MSVILPRFRRRAAAPPRSGAPVRPGPLVVAGVAAAVTVAVAGSLLPAAAAPAGRPARTPAVPAAVTAAGLPRPDHLVVVIDENHGYSSIVGSSAAPYLNSLISQGALFTQSFAVTHPSEPNYLALFSGSTQGITDDSCPNDFSVANLGSELIAAGVSFTGYSESMPSNGYTGCDVGTYARKHNPWVMFGNVPAADNLVYSAFPTDFTKLPAVSFVVPNLNDDMHDGTVQQGDSWLKSHIDAYAQWAKTHNSDLLITWDEDEDSGGTNRIPTIAVGAHVKQGSYSEHINHYNVLRTIEDFYNLPHVGASASATPITDAFTGGGTQNTVTVTSPGAQTTAIGTAVNLPITATDSAAGQTLAYSATGLPAGLAVDAATGVISGTPTAAGSGTVTVTATDTAGASGSASFTWTVTGTGATAIVNGGFEAGSLTGWTRSGTTAVVSSPVHSGTHAARLGSTSPTNGDSKISQTFTAPAGATHVSFWYDMSCPDDVTYDWATASLKDTTTATTKTVLAKTCTLNAGWKQVTAAVVAGHTYTLTLVSHDEDNPGDPTYTVYDDVAAG